MDILSIQNLLGHPECMSCQQDCCLDLNCVELRSFEDPDTRSGIILHLVQCLIVLLPRLFD